MDVRGKYTVVITKTFRVDEANRIIYTSDTEFTTTLCNYYTTPMMVDVRMVGNNGYDKTISIYVPPVSRVTFPSTIEGTESTITYTWYEDPFAMPSFSTMEPVLPEFAGLREVEATRMAEEDQYPRENGVEFSYQVKLVQG